jgi:ferrous iron transport protein A
MKLLDAKVERLYKVVSIEGGCLSKDRLIKLGILPGVLIELKRKAPLRGPFMVSLNGSDIVIGRGIASKIEVEESK